MTQILLAAAATLFYGMFSGLVLKQPTSFVELAILYLIIILLYDSIERRRHD
jgi:hypothetical protein